MTKWAIENLSIGEAPVVLFKRQAISMQKEGVKRQGNRVGARDREDLHQTSGRGGECTQIINRIGACQSPMLTK